MTHTATILTAANGTITDSNEAALDLLGRCKGRKCWDAVGALQADRSTICEPGCARALLVDKSLRDHGQVQVRGVTMNLTCQAVGATVVVEINEVDASSARLSPREREVLAQIAEGKSTAQVATSLGVAGSTIRQHVENARAKLGARTRAQAVAIAVRGGVLDSP